MPIQSVLDNDLYKFTMQNAVLKNFAGEEVEYQFKDRKPSGLYNDAFLAGFNRELERMSEMVLSADELKYIQENLRFLNRPDYIAYLHDFRFDPNQIKASVDGQGNFDLAIKGTWDSAILWEVPLLSIVSEQYFRYCDTNWNMEGQYELADKKSTALSLAGCQFADFGTRRRRNSTTQEIFIKQAKGKNGFIGTSNVHFARLFNLKAIGTMAHEWIMGVSGKDGLRRANRDALNRWADTYDGDLGIALTDTYGSAAFFEDFDGKLARLYDGVRHDSGDAFKFGDQVIDHYKKLGIKPISRTIVFSDGLDVDLAIRIKQYFAGRINVSFGIGTHFTNDFCTEGSRYMPSKALSIVIKLYKIAGVPVVKISDEPAKIQGDKDACRVAKWTFFGTPLDEVERDHLVPSLHGWHPDADGQPIPPEKLGEEAKKVYDLLKSREIPRNNNWSDRFIDSPTEVDASDEAINFLDRKN